MKFLIRTFSLLTLVVFCSSSSSINNKNKANFFIDYSIHTMDGDKEFKMETVDGFNAFIIDSQNGEVLIEIVDDNDDQKRIIIKCDGKLAAGKQKVLAGNFYSDTFDKTYNYHSDMYLNIQSIDDTSVSGSITGYCYDNEVSHNYKMKLTGSFRLMLLQ